MPEDGGNGQPPVVTDSALTEALGMVEERIERRFWISPEALLQELQTIKGTRVPTGMASLDKAFKGGLPGGTVVSLVGPPGSCKSVFALQLGLKRAFVTNKRVYVYAPDQGGMQPLARLAETFGDVTTSNIVFQQFCEQAAAFVRIADDREREVTLEWFRDAVLEATDCAAVIVDTPQTVATKEEMEERQQINATMDVCRQIASRLVVPVFVAHHASRAATAARKIENRLLPRAAGLGSAQIEHRSQVLMFMEAREATDENENLEVDLQVVKVTFGRPGLKIRLRLDVGRGRLYELDRREIKEEYDTKKEIARSVRNERIEAAILDRLRKTPEGMSGKAIEELIEGTHTDVRAALRSLEKKGPVLAETRGGKGGGILWKLARGFSSVVPARENPT